MHRNAPFANNAAPSVLSTFACATPIGDASGLHATGLASKPRVKRGKLKEPFLNHVYLLFLGMALVTVASPGPGVLMTLNNAIRGGWLASMHGVVGLALGAAAMAGLCSAGVGVLIRSSQPLFLVLKYCGVAYLFYLAYATWRGARLARPTFTVGEQAAHPRAPGLSTDTARHGPLLLKGALLQTSNPKSLLFFLSVLPQFATDGGGNASLPRLIAAIGTYCVALVLVHAAYAGIASRAKVYLGRPGTSRLLSRIGALAFLAFGVALLVLKF
ncbi:LysE family translocator [Paraburkholderia sp. Se-20369]|nr:LysE family translocator [Paraburkholderia sp. Se-20369]